METSDNFIKEILGKGPSPETIYFVLSKMKEKGQLKEVIEECLKALDKYQDDTNIRRLLSESYFEDGQLTEAESALKEVITHIEDSISCYRFQAELLIKQKREDEAIKSLKLYLVHRPDDQEAFNLLESLQPQEEISDEHVPATGEESVSIEEPEQETIGVTEEEGLPDMATTTLGEVYLAQGQIEKAVEIYEKVIVQKPDDAESRQRLDEIKGMMEQGRPEGTGREDRARKRKERMIGILESWLGNIREQSNASVTLN